jgi:hypothetical protein
MDTKFKGKFERVPDDTPVTAPVDTEFAGMFTPSGVSLQGEGQTQPPAGPSPTPDQFLGEKVTTGRNVKAETVQSHSSQKPKKGVHGVNVTDEFPEADLANMTVYHDMKKNLFIVVDPGSDEVLKKAASEKGVTKFLKEQLG